MRAVDLSEAEVHESGADDARPPARTFTDLIVWQKAHAFVLAVYQLTESFPRSEGYGLSAQFRRAAISIAANIAEGFKKRGPADRARFLNVAQDSLEECQYCLILARDLGDSGAAELRPQLEEVSTLLEACTSAVLHAAS